MGSLANVAPVFDFVYFYKLVKHIVDIVGVPKKVLKTSAQVNAERQQKQQQMEQMKQMQTLQQTAQAGRDLAPLAKVLPEDAKAIAEGLVNN